MNFKAWKELNQIPFNFENNLMYKVITNLEGLNWYNDLYNKAKKYYPQDYKLYLGLLAVSSQRNTLEVNESLTVNAINMIKEFNNPYVLNYGIADKPIKNNIKRILSGKLPRGNKIKPYYKALVNNDLNQVIIDSWILKIFNLKHSYKYANKNDVKYIKYIIKKIAKKLKLKPCEVQSCLWYYARKELNDLNHILTKHEYYFNLATKDTPQTTNK